MKALIIYDTTGHIWNIIYGATEVPQGLPTVFVDIPDGATIDRIDVTDPKKPKPIFTYLPDTDFGRLQKEVKTLEEQLTKTEAELATQREVNQSMQGEVTDLQLAITELYEGLGV